MISKYMSMVFCTDLFGLLDISLDRLEDPPHSMCNAEDKYRFLTFACENLSLSPHLKVPLI